MSSDLRRPSDAPRPPDEPPGEPPDRSPRLRDLYVDDPDDIFDTTDIPRNHRNADRGDARTEGGSDVFGTSGAEQAAKGAENDPDAPPASGSNPDSGTDELFGFDPRRAGLEDITAEEAAAYIATHSAGRPWLAAAEGHHPQVQRVYAALDNGQGHALPRHDDHGTDETYQRRVQYLEDPAQLDDTKRAAGIDGCKPGNKKHYCAEYSTRIHDATAFATAFARGVEHPEVRAALDRKFDPKDPPDSVRIPISSLLGENGHHSCSGVRLVGDDSKQAREDRKNWLAAGKPDDVAEPRAEPIPTFKEGVIEFRFGRNRAGDGYEVLTMFPDLFRDPKGEGDN